MTASDLITEIDAFLAENRGRMTETTFGKLAVNDGKFVAEIRGGRRVWPETAEKVRAFMRDYRPAVPASTASEATA